MLCLSLSMTYLWPVTADSRYVRWRPRLYVQICLPILRIRAVWRRWTHSMQICTWKLYLAVHSGRPYAYLLSVWTDPIHFILFVHSRLAITFVFLVECSCKGFFSPHIEHGSFRKSCLKKMDRTVVHKYLFHFLVLECHEKLLLYETARTQHAFSWKVVAPINITFPAVKASSLEFWRTQVWKNQSDANDRRNYIS